jgi:hypothetical protein
MLPTDRRCAATGDPLRRPAWVPLTRLRGVGLNASGLVGFLKHEGMSLNHDPVFLRRAQRNEAPGMGRGGEAGASECHYS